MGREGHLQCLAWGSLPHRSTKFCKCRCWESKNSKSL